MKNSSRKTKIVVISLLVIPVITLLFAYTQYASIKPTVIVGRALIVKPAYGNTLLAKFGDNSLSAAKVTNAKVGDNVTFFLDNGEVTNSPSSHTLKYISGVFTGLFNGIIITYLLVIFLKYKKKI